MGIDVAMTVPAPDIRNWIRNIEQHASDNVNKILVGNKADMDESKRVHISYPVTCTFLAVYSLLQTQHFCFVSMRGILGVQVPGTWFHPFPAEMSLCFGVSICP